MKTLEERFWAKVEKTESCWLWTGAILDGYGILRDGPRMLKAHRFSYELHNGPIPKRVEVRHFVCEIRKCVRPDHLRVGTHSDNQRDIPFQRRSESKRRMWANMPLESRALHSQKIAASKLGKKLSPEHRAKIAAAHRGLKQSDEQRQRHAEKMKELWKAGKFNAEHTPEQLAANSAKHRELWASGAYANRKPKGTP